MMTNAKIGVALVGGYALGRTKKAKLAIGLGMFLAGRKLSVDPRQLGRLVADSPFLSSLNDQARRELVDATKSAATSALTRRVSGLADSLHERTLDLGEPGRRLRRATGGEDAEETDAEETDAEETDAEETDARNTDAEESDAGPEAEPRRERGAKASSRPASKRSTAKAAPAKAASKPRSASRKSGTAKAASGTGKATSGARKATSGARRTTRQGGGHG
ncbi:hypothetical protein [Streptomyces sp. NRRL F-5135]|uniref:hypothetical protein n=1 Tax=Streptomyces sp. NRRL F-5135 TaxID=1463858 RepID=UPI0004C9B1E6|nr:hypothetical protein [Streptomyces sp. NRRL F-5135]